MILPTPHEPLYHAAAYILLIKDGKIYLQRRVNTGFQDGKYNLPAGHIEEGETPVQAAIREAQEEAGLGVNEGDLQFLQSMFRKSPPRVYADFYFLVKNWQGEPKIGEPHKADADGWFELDKLPELLPYLYQVIENYKSGKIYSEFGWE